MKGILFLSALLISFSALAENPSSMIQYDVPGSGCRPYALVPGTNLCLGFEWAGTITYYGGQYENTWDISSPRFNPPGAKHPNFSSGIYYVIGQNDNTQQREYNPSLAVFITAKTVGGKERIVETSSSFDPSSNWTRIEKIDFESRKDTCWTVRVSPSGVADLQNSFVVEHVDETPPFDSAMPWPEDPVQKKNCERAFPEDFKK